jgi:DNA (cytosine-5)-methyltransferase 1
VKNPDMDLYQEIIYLKHWFKGKWVVENVIGYYDPLIQPQEINNHFFWANFYIHSISKETRKIRNEKNHIEKRAEQLGIDLKKIEGNSGFKRKILNNCVEPETGLHIFQEAFREYKTLNLK